MERPDRVLNDHAARNLRGHALELPLQRVAQLVGHVVEHPVVLRVDGDGEAYPLFGVLLREAGTPPWGGLTGLHRGQDVSRAPAGLAARA